MTEPNSYVPMLNDPVLLEDSDNSLVVIDIDASRRTAALRTIAGPAILYENVPWSKLSYRDECESPYDVGAEARSPIESATPVDLKRGGF